MSVAESTYLEHCKVLPEWVSKRVVTIASRKRDSAEIRDSTIGRKFLKDSPSLPLERYIRELEYLGTVVLQGELKEYPELANHVPEPFISALVHSSTGTNLSPLEQAVIIIIDEDSSSATHTDFLSDIVAFLHLKWESIGMMLDRW